MNADWKDMLSSLKGSLPEGEEEKPVKNNEENIKTKQSGKLTVVTDRKGRNGKTATIIEGFTLPQEEVEEIARKLKSKLGLGGSTREGEILIQGEHKDKIKDLLKEWNFKVN